MIILFFFSACASSGPTTGGTDEVVVGDGLEMSFSIQAGDLIGLRQVEYELKMSNSGKNPVKITRDSFTLSTLELLSEGQSVFEAQSLDDFYDNVFDGNSEFVLLTGSKIERAGALYIEESYYDNLNKEELNYKLKVAYDYKTEFSNNVEIDLTQQGELTTDTVTQAAPVKITDINLDVFGRDDYRISYTLRDTRNSDAELEVYNVDLNLGSESFSDSSCDLFRRENSQLIPIDSRSAGIRFNDENREAVLACPISLSNFDEGRVTNTVTFGSFEYRYTIQEEGTIRLPDGRSFERR